MQLEENFSRECNAGRFSEDEARFYFQKLISGVSYCHSMIADVWSCGVTLYVNVMLVGAYPFEDPDDPRNFKKTLTRILTVQYSIPDYVRISMECRRLLSRIFVADPEKRITIPEIKQHPWFLKNLPIEFMEREEEASLQMQGSNADSPSQSMEEVLAIIQEARKPADDQLAKDGGDRDFVGGSMDLDDDDDDDDDDIIDTDIEIGTSGEFVCTL